MATSLIEDTWSGEGASIAQIERELARLRDATSTEGGQPTLRTSVMTHIAWVPPDWLGAAETTLLGMAERHPSRTLILVPARSSRTASTRRCRSAASPSPTGRCAAR